MTSTTPSSSATSSSPSQSEDEYAAAEEKTDLLYGAENAVARGVQFMQNVKVSMDLFGGKNGPSIIMEFDVYKNNYIDVIRRGGRIRLITEITNENLHYCKGVVNIVTELRHLEGLIGGIAVSESEYMSTTTLRWRVSNLISNSVKFTQRGDVTITAEIIKNNNDSNDDNGSLNSKNNR
jgi:hypothetical protein